MSNDEQVTEMIEEIADELLSVAAEKLDLIDALAIEIEDIKSLVAMLHDDDICMDDINRAAKDIEWSNTMFDVDRFDELNELLPEAAE